jgi:hypothetical protein
VITVALVEQAAASKVTRGENTGRTLTHVNIVRALATAPLHDVGSLTLKLNGIATDTPTSSLSPQKYFVVVFAQHEGTMAVLGATFAAWQ